MTKNLHRSFLALAAAVALTFSGCKDEPGDVLFYGECCAPYTVTIDGQTKTYNGTNLTTTPDCGSVSANTATFSLEPGTYSFVWSRPVGYTTTGSGGNIFYPDPSMTGILEYYSGATSVTITEDDCKTIEWQ